MRRRRRERARRREQKAKEKAQAKEQAQAQTKEAYIAHPQRAAVNAFSALMTAAAEQVVIHKEFKQLKRMDEMSEKLTELQNKNFEVEIKLAEFQMEIEALKNKTPQFLNDQLRYALQSAVTDAIRVALEQNPGLDQDQINEINDFAQSYVGVQGWVGRMIADKDKPKLDLDQVTDDLLSELEALIEPEAFIDDLSEAAVHLTHIQKMHASGQLSERRSALAEKLEEINDTLENMSEKAEASDVEELIEARDQLMSDMAMLQDPDAILKLAVQRLSTEMEKINPNDHSNETMEKALARLEENKDIDPGIVKYIRSNINKKVAIKSPELEQAMLQEFDQAITNEEALSKATEALERTLEYPRALKHVLENDRKKIENSDDPNQKAGLEQQYRGMLTHYEDTMRRYDKDLSERTDEVKDVGERHRENNINKFFKQFDSKISEYKEQKQKEGCSKEEIEQSVQELRKNLTSLLKQRTSGMLPQHRDHVKSKAESLTQPKKAERHVKRQEKHAESSSKSDKHFTRKHRWLNQGSKVKEERRAHREVKTDNVQKPSFGKGN